MNDSTAAQCSVCGRTGRALGAVKTGVWTCLEREGCCPYFGVKGERDDDEDRCEAEDRQGNASHVRGVEGADVREGS